MCVTETGQDVCSAVTTGSDNNKMCADRLVTKIPQDLCTAVSANGDYIALKCMELLMYDRHRSGCLQGCNYDDNNTVFVD